MASASWSIARYPGSCRPRSPLTLHPFDLATNKVLALVGRLEVRDWVDVLACDEHVQPLGYLACAGPPPDAGALSRQWHQALERADAVVHALPPDDVGAAVLSRDGTLFTDAAEAIAPALAEHRIHFHRGRIGGALARPAG